MREAFYDNYNELNVDGIADAIEEYVSARLMEVDMSKIWQTGQMPPQHPETDRKPQAPPPKRKPRKRKR
jgi:hypothetical protein